MSRTTAERELSHADDRAGSRLAEASRGEILALLAAGVTLAAEIDRRYGVSRERAAQIADASEDGRIPLDEIAPDPKGATA